MYVLYVSITLRCETPQNFTWNFCHKMHYFSNSIRLSKFAAKILHWESDFWLGLFKSNHCIYLSVLSSRDLVQNVFQNFLENFEDRKPYCKWISVSWTATEYNDVCTVYVCASYPLLSVTATEFNDVGVLIYRTVPYIRTHVSFGTTCCGRAYATL